jgi:hypothetical protein
MNWYAWLGYHSNDINADTEIDALESMKKAYVAGLRQAFDLLDNASPEDFHWCRREIEKLIEESE